MLFLIKTVYIPLSETARFVKLIAKLLLDNVARLPLVSTGSPLCSHVVVGRGLGAYFRVTVNETFPAISLVLFRVENVSTIGGTAEKRKCKKKRRL